LTQKPDQKLDLSDGRKKKESQKKTGTNRAV
jgi:hypothetical protein